MLITLPPLSGELSISSRRSGRATALTEGSKLHSGDQYKVWFTAEQESYVYIFQLDSSQTIYRLFPLQDFQGVTVNQTNPVQTGRQYHTKWY